ncbi:MAG: MFS transporter [Hyphomonadaceae bacterium]
MAVADEQGAARKSEPPRRGSVFDPLRYPIFLRIWLASLASNFGMLIQGVGAAWAMTQLTPSADMVAMVQTASFLPVMFLALAAGAIADMFDRRIIGIVAISISFAGAATLSVCWFLQLVTPESLLGFCFVIGIGMALFGPSWQASVSEQVPAKLLPQAVSLNSISFNIARSFGPAIGGVLVAAFGAVSAFIANMLLYVPMIVALSLWRRPRETPRLPPEGLGRAMISGVRYVLHSPSVRVVMVRTLLMGGVGGAISALMPLVARDLVRGGALTYGALLGAFGVGAVLGALNLAPLRTRFSNEAVVRSAIFVLGLAAIVTGMSHSMALSAAALVAGGAAWMIAMASYNIEVQLAAPRWVAGRLLATFQAAISTGIALGAILWGHLAEAYGVGVALTASGAAMLGTLGLTVWLRMPSTESAVEDAREAFADPEVTMALTPRSGPIIIEIDYRIDPEQARAFYTSMLELQRTRQRNGAYGWSISRDIAAPDRWTERFHCPTWHDYLRQRSRMTQGERSMLAAIYKMHQGIGAPPIRRLLERPFGSVRWREDTPDVVGDAPRPIAGPGAP